MTVTPHHLRYATLICAIFVCLISSAVNASGEEIDNASARDFNAAAALQNAGLHTRAAVKWQAFISQYPENERIGRAHYYLGVCRLRAKKFDEAAQTFESVLGRWPDLEQADKAQYNLAMCHYELASQANNPDALRQAAKEFEQVPAKYPKSELTADALYYQGDCLLSAGDLPPAVAAFQKLIAGYPDDSQALRAHYDLGIALQELGKADEAAKTFQAFLNKPEYANHQLAPEMRLRLAVCWHDLEKLDEAVEEFNRVAQINEYDLAHYAAFRLGQTKMQLGKYDEAASLLNEFPKKFRESEYQADAIKTAGQCYFLAGKPQEAARILPPIANGNDPAAAEASYWLARSQLKLNQPAPALAVLEKALGRSANDPFATYLKFARIDALYEIPDRRAETAALYEAFWRENPDHKLAPQAAYMAALASFGQQQYGKAIEISERYLSQHPTQADELTGDLQFIAAESHLLESPDDAEARKKAEAYFRELVSKQPDHPRASQIHLRIGWCLQAAEKHQDAINYLRGQLSKFDKKEQLPEAQLLIGRSHARLNQHREAVDAFRASIVANENWKEIDEVLIESAESYLALEELDQASQQLQRLISARGDSPRRPRALYMLGQIAQSRDQADQAIDWFRQVADSFADTEFGPPAMHALAALYLEKQQYPQTREWGTRLIDGKFPEELKQRGRYVRGIALSRENNFDNAASDLTTYLKQPVDDEEAAGAAYALSLCRIGQKQFDEARKVLGDLLKSDPHFAHAEKAFYELGHGLRADGKLDEANEAFAWITVNRPDSPLAAEAWFRVAQLQVEKARSSDGEEKNAALDSAEKSLKNGILKASEDDLRESMAYLMGDIQYQRQRYAEAAETLTKQINQFQNGTYVGPATFLAAQSRFQLKQYDQALPLYIKVTDVNFANTPPEQVESYQAQSLYRAGDCAAKLARWQESQTHFQTLVDRHPQFAQRPEARYGVAYALQQQNQLDQAVEIYDQVTKETETETAAKARFMIGEIEFGRKKYEDAIEQFLIVTVGYPYESWQALAKFETARCFVELGDQDRAVKTLNDMIAKHADHPRAADAKTMLSNLNQ